jgi:hypothetical protein
MYCSFIVEGVSLEKTQSRKYLKRRTTGTRQAEDYDIRGTQASCHLQSLHLNCKILSMGAEISADVRDSLMSFLQHRYLYFFVLSSIYLLSISSKKRFLTV